MGGMPRGVRGLFSSVRSRLHPERPAPQAPSSGDGMHKRSPGCAPPCFWLVPSAQYHQTGRILDVLDVPESISKTAPRAMFLVGHLELDQCRSYPTISCDPSSRWFRLLNPCGTHSGGARNSVPGPSREKLWFSFRVRLEAPRACSTKHANTGGRARQEARKGL